MNCPICKKPFLPKDQSDPKSPYPFCSDRCRLIDLGRWLDGKYQIPTIEDDGYTRQDPPQHGEDDSVTG